MNRRASFLIREPFVWLLALFVTASPFFRAAAATASQGGQDGRPNILFILADDQGWADVGYHGSEISTPYIDQLATTGIRFEKHYVLPTCSPTRAAFLFGQYPSRLGVLYPIRSANHLPRNMMTLPRLLQHCGYSTHISGKWHLGQTPEYGPCHYGFDTSYGYLHGQIDPYTHRHCFGEISWHRNGRFFEEEGHATDLITQEAIRVVESSGDKPFFLYVAYSVPHYPLNEPEKWTSLYEGKITQKSRKLYAASVSHMDDGIGRILASLDRTGKRERTLVVFTSDNGAQQSWRAPKTHYNGRYEPNPVLGSNFPLRGWKTYLTEGGIRVPALVSWPGTIQPRVSNATLHVVDWMPTFAHLAGGDEMLPENLDGQNFLDLIQGKLGSPSRGPLYWKTNGGTAILAGSWKLIIHNSEKKELFNLSEDPCEKHNLAAEHSERVSSLTEELRAIAESDRDWAPEE